MCLLETFGGAERLLEACPERARRVDVEAGQLVLRDLCTDGRRQRITTDDDDATECRLTEQQRRQQIRRLVDAQVLDVVDDEDACLRRQRLRERSGYAAQRALGTRSQCT